MDNDKKLSAHDDQPDLEALFAHIRSHKEQVKIEHEEIDTQVKVLIHQKEQLDHSKKYLELQEKVLENLKQRSKSIQDKEIALIEREAGLNRLEESIKIEKIAFDLSKAELQGQYEKLSIDKRQALAKQAAELDERSSIIEREEKALQIQQESFNKRFISMENKEGNICNRELELEQRLKKLVEAERSIEKQKTQLKHRTAMLNDKEEALRLQETELNRREQEFEKMRKDFESNHHTVRLPENSKVQIVRVSDDSTKPQPWAVSIKPTSNAKSNDHMDGILALCHKCGKGSDNFVCCDHCTEKLGMPLNIIAKSLPSNSGTTLRTITKTKRTADSTANEEQPVNLKDCKTYVRTPKCRRIEEQKSDNDSGDKMSVVVKQECGGKIVKAPSQKMVEVSMTCNYETREKPVETSTPLTPPEEKLSPVTVSLQKISKIPGIASNQQNGSSQKIDYSVFLTCKRIAIGSYDYTPTVGILMSSYGIRLTAPLIKNNKSTTTINLKNAELKRILVNFDQSAPIIFIYLTPEAGAIIRRHLRMKERSGPYFDPVSKDQTHRRIILFPEKFVEESKDVLKNMYKGKFQELNKNEANRFLTKATLLNNNEESGT